MKKSKQKSDKDIALSADVINKAFDYINEYKKEKKALLCSLKKSAEKYSYIPFKFINDEDVVLEFIAHDHNLFKYASDRLKSSPDFLLKAIKKNPYVYINIKTEYKTISITMAAVRKDGDLLKFAPIELQNNEQIVTEAVKNTHIALSYASDEMKGNPSIALIAINQNIEAIELVNESLKKDKQFFNDVVSIDHKCMDWFGFENIRTFIDL